MIAICITTRNRPEAFAKVVSKIREHTISDYVLITVDDASNEEYATGDIVHRFDQRKGIPTAKNKCIEIAMSNNPEHIFLFDDDCYPIKDGWEKEYINSGFNHLCFTFLKDKGRKGNIKIHSLGNGCMMYVNRKCIETIGGFDLNFGFGKYEHVDFSRRINNSGLTKYKFMDLANSSELLHSMDRNNEIERSFDKNEIKTLLRSGVRHFNKERRSTKYIPYK